jgi:ribonucleotide monophosphatase NagD (HAD superfamily)
MADLAARPRNGARLIAGFESIASQYDGFILDQFGVMHNGVVALPGAAECYKKLAASGKKLVILSNTSRRAANAQSKLPGMGFDPSALSGFVSSGEEAYQYIQKHLQGKTCLFMTWEREAAEPGASFLEGLDVRAAPARNADFILCHGTEVISTGDDMVTPTGFMNSGDLGPYQAALEEAMSRDLEMLVANADVRATLPDGSLGHMPGR